MVFVNILVFVRIQKIKYVFVLWFLVEPKFWDKHKKTKLRTVGVPSSSKLECGCYSELWVLHVWHNLIICLKLM